MSDEQVLVVGLGNPGTTYAGNRHNVGQMVLDVLADRARLTYKSHKAGAVVAEGRLRPGGPRVILAKPASYMNLSGGPVAQLARFFKVPVDRVVVVHDELDIDFDTVRIKVGGGHGGHNGIRDVSARLGTPDYVRVRVGIGRPPGRMDAADFVLKDFGTDERKSLPNLLEDAADAVEAIVDDGVLAAQNRVNQRA
ncbi:MAG TPA: aminoacyl-tRNA hydrolase [Microbacteriaceae bacterium]|nr:aminoacyl-tRNA hydrolase [Microbacteriaceae bacterium]